MATYLSLGCLLFRPATVLKYLNVGTNAHNTFTVLMLRDIMVDFFFFYKAIVLNFLFIFLPFCACWWEAELERKHQNNNGKNLTSLYTGDDTKMHSI